MFGPQKTSNGILRLHVKIFLMCGRGAWGSPELLGKQLDKSWLMLEWWYEKLILLYVYDVIYIGIYLKKKTSYHTKQLKEFSTTPIWFSMFFFGKVLLDA